MREREGRERGVKSDTLSGIENWREKRVSIWER